MFACQRKTRTITSGGISGNTKNWLDRCILSRLPLGNQLQKLPNGMFKILTQVCSLKKTKCKMDLLPCVLHVRLAQALQINPVLTPNPPWTVAWTLAGLQAKGGVVSVVACQRKTRTITSGGISGNTKNWLDRCILLTLPLGHQLQKLPNGMFKILTQVCSFKKTNVRWISCHADCMSDLPRRCKSTPS